MSCDIEPHIEAVDVAYTPKQAAEPVLRNATLRIPRGQWVSLIGSNGSGKSTLIRLLNGLLPIDSGIVRVGGIELRPDTVADIRAKIGMVFANPDDQFVGMSVREDIAFGMENRCLPRSDMHRRLKDTAERLAVAGLLERHPSELSGGQKQRVALASVLATDPEILILDEASSMLDEASKFDLLQLIRELRERRELTVVSVTHDWDEIMASDRVLGLADGTIAADVDPGALQYDRSLLEAFRLNPTFLSRLRRSLAELGVDAGRPRTQEQLLEALWAYTSSK